VWLLVVFALLLPKLGSHFIDGSRHDFRSAAHIIAREAPHAAVMSDWPGELQYYLEPLTGQKARYWGGVAADAPLVVALGTNAQGFRSRTPTALPKPDGRFRIVTLGDSVAIGMGVADDETFSAQTERLLRQRFPGKDLDVVNLGIPGYDTRQEVGLLRRHAAE